MCSVIIYKCKFHLQRTFSPQTITAIQQLRAKPVRTSFSPPSSQQHTRLNTTSTQITTITPALQNVGDKCIYNTTFKWNKTSNFNLKQYFNCWSVLSLNLSKFHVLNVGHFFSFSMCTCRMYLKYLRVQGLACCSCPKHIQQTQGKTQWRSTYYIIRLSTCYILHLYRNKRKFNGTMDARICEARWLTGHESEGELLLIKVSYLCLI